MASGSVRLVVSDYCVLFRAMSQGMGTQQRDVIASRTVQAVDYGHRWVRLLPEAIGQRFTQPHA